ncbi:MULTISPECIES: hypothetical protein [Acetobacter]|uniref:hypothetical protein n=1 Tax=Acetobacter TaxID=434 RepID=UPI00142EEFE0|nr:MULTISPECIES: hypothetical protein [Acetobacter]MCP1203769.1 hypothetical protein [Acetobacter oryzoeni]MDN7350163.1 hypothetical protein [Acetobacter senegalensis]
MLLLTVLIVVVVVGGIILLVCLNKFGDWLMTTDVLSPSLIMLCTYLACMFLFHRHD